MDHVNTQALILAALAPLHKAVAKLSHKQNNLGARLAISELLAIAVINTHPNPSELEAAFINVVLEAEVAHQRRRTLQQRHDLAIPDLGKRIGSRAPITTWAL